MCICTTAFLSIHPDGHLGCFHVLAIINSAAMNIGVHVSLSILVSLVCMPRSGIAGSYTPLSDLWFVFHFSRRWTHKELAFYVRLCPVYIFLKDFIVSIITSRYLCSLVFILCLVLGCFLISFSFSWLRESSWCPPEWVFPICIPSPVEEGSLVCTPSQHSLFAECLATAIPLGVM